ncbi:MAG: PBSX family phage terminase large subunit [Oscillospiraceae bacterium]
MAEFAQLSPKQAAVMTWWRKGSADREKDAIICDGAVRSGKTVCTCLSFCLWAMSRYTNQNFALCGKTMKGVRRNILEELRPALRRYGFHYTEKQGQSMAIIRMGRRENRFYFFGGKDEGSAGLIQGVTLAGVLMDEVALMPRSFVEQALARCSVPGSKLWFSCNPEGPGHWFYREWICKTKEKNALYLHFTMDDNPSLTAAVKARFRRQFHGTFYRRFILGEWVAAEGVVYDFFTPDMVKKVPRKKFAQFRISCDYGTVNPTSMGLWGELEGVWYRLHEYYYDSKKMGGQKTDREYADALKKLAGDRKIERVIVDPSAASFIEVLRRDGWQVQRGENDVLAGIRVTGRLLKEGKIVLCDSCPAILAEIGDYAWESRGDGTDRVKKTHDHAMDEMRYFAMTVEGKPAQFASCAVARYT